MIKSWLMLKSVGVPAPFGQVLGMAMRKTLDRDLVGAMAVAYRLDLQIPLAALEAHALAGGRVKDVVQAAVALRQMGEAFDSQKLMALDLQSSNLPELVAAYSRVKEKYDRFPFGEFADRFIQGEDVVAGAHSGELLPFARTEGWQVRVEYGPLSAEALAELLEQMKGDATVTVMRPRGDRWEPASRFRKALKDGASAPNNG